MLDPWMISIVQVALNPPSAHIFMQKEAIPMNEHLDTKKNVIISAPAGSGKTERLARRYISLLEDGSEVEKILAITFTEKAAAEMKDRILTIIQSENSDIFIKIKEKIPLMRITTIHAFCRKLISRFALDIGLDPSLDVLDEHRSTQLWSASVYEALRDEKDKPSVFFEYLAQKGIKGWGILFRILNEIHARRPYSDFLTESSETKINSEEDVLLEIYEKCLRKYTNKKREVHAIDFNDMEILAYRAITTNPEWLNILYAFDEHTDHILVDEFQDTNSIQWKIIDKLTEEWRSGLGAKRAEGKTPTVFLVGDEKQSIYMFRGANVAVFHEVKKRFRDWFGKDTIYQEPGDNYRSLPAIIRFTNTLFGQIMKESHDKPWRTKYAPFTASREGSGKIELLLLDYESDTRQTRNKEATLIAQKILSIVGSSDIYPDAVPRKCRFSDVAILLRSRTHLPSFESALREHNIPYVVEGGMGFYAEPEVALLRELVSCVIDPSDDFSLFEVLRSPLFGLKESALFNLLSFRREPLYEKLEKTKSALLVKSRELLDRYRSKISDRSISFVIEEFLSDTGNWKIFHELQRHSNVKKFLRILDDYESQGLSHSEIKENLIRSKKSNEAKANVNPEGTNAVKIMTIHGAKGRQFPFVILPSLDEALSPKSSPVFVDEIGLKVQFAYEEDAVKRRKKEHFALRKEKELEEEKRLFYVAVTRAMDHLFLSGALKRDNDRNTVVNGRLAFIEEAYSEAVSSGRAYNKDFNVIREEDIQSTPPSDGVILGDDIGKFFKGDDHTEPIDLTSESLRWLDVTEDIEIRSTHGKDWMILGSIFHRLFEELSKNILAFEDIDERIDRLLHNEPSLEGNIDNLRESMQKVFMRLENARHLREVILPSENAFAELPFILQKDGKVYKGRIDRIIIKGSTAYIYDYKTFPVRDREISDLMEKYRFQMKIYGEAVNKLFSLKTRSFIFFTHRPLIMEVKI
jgi:ATP-dependent helicase/nuclease subunit A